MPISSIRFQRDERKTILILLTLAGFFIGTTASLVNAWPTVFNDLSISPLDVYEIDILSIHPLPESEIWVSEETLWIKGQVIIIASNDSAYNWFEIEGKRYLLQSNESIILDSQLMQGSAMAYLVCSNGTHSELQKFTFSIYSLNEMKTIQFLFPIMEITFFTMIGGGISVIICGTPRKEIEKPSSQFVIDASTETQLEPKYVIKRTDKIIDTLRKNIDDVKDTSRNLITIHLAIVTTLVGVVYLVLPLPYKFIYKGSFILLCGFAIFISGYTVYRLLQVQPRRKIAQRTPWSEEWNVVLNKTSIDDTIAHRIWLLNELSSLSQEDMYMQNLVEIRFLYNALAKMKKRIEVGQKTMYVPLLVSINAIVMLTLPILGFWAFFIAILISIVGGLININNTKHRLLREFQFTRLVLYYSEESTDDSLDQNEGFELDWLNYGLHGVVPVDTTDFTNEEMSNLQQAVKAIYEASGNDPNSSSLYGPNQGAFDYCGRQVPVLIILQGGDNSIETVYPKKVQADAIKTIAHRLARAVH